MDLELGDTRLIIDTCRKHDLLRNQAAYVLATAYWETNRTMQPVREAYWLSEKWRRDHLRYYPWYGRGYVQLTWENNYKRAASKLSVPLDEEPDLAMRSDVAANVIVLGMKEGWFTGKRLADYITLRKSGFHYARKIVNALDKAKEIADIARDYDKALKAEGYGEEPAPQPPQPAPEPVQPVPPPVTPEKPKTPPTGLWAALARILKAILTGGKQ